MNRASKCILQRGTSVVTAVWTHNVVIQNVVPRAFCAVLSTSILNRNDKLKREKSLCKGRQLWHMLNERLHSIVRRNLLLHGQHVMFKSRNVLLISIDTDLKNSFSTSTDLCYTSKRDKMRIIYKGNKSSLENVSWHADDDPGLNKVLSQIQNHVAKDTESESAIRVNSLYQTGNSSSGDMLNDGNMDDIDGMESQIIQRIERYADDTVENSHNIEILSEEDSELVDLTKGGNSVMERKSHEKDDFHSDRSSQALRDQEIEDFTTDGKFSRDEIEDFYEEEIVEDEVPKWTSPVELTRGKTGVFDLDELVAVLKSENARDLCVMRLPAEARLCDYMIIASGMSARHVGAIVETIRFIYKKKKSESDPWMKIEGGKGDDWVAADLGNMILHVMMPETREYYDLETLWTVGAEYDDKCNDSDDNFLVDLDWLREFNENQTNQ